MTDPTTPAAPEEPTPATDAASVVPEAAPVVPEAAPVVPEAPAAPVAEPVVPPAAPAAPAANPYAAPAAAPAAGYAPAGAPVKQTLSIVSFILGIVGVIFAFVYGFGLIPGIVAVILGFQAKKKEPGAPKWMSLTGRITGFVAIGLSLIFGLLGIIAIVACFALLSSGGYYYN